MTLPNNSKPSQMPLTSIQSLIGQRMLHSKRHKPCFYLSIKADVTELMGLRRKYSKAALVRVATNDFCIRAIALAIEKYPLMAGEFDGDHIQIANSINVGLAVAAPQGLVVPIVKDANKKKLPQIAKESAEFINKAKSNNLIPDDMTGAAITLTGLGMYGIDSFIAVASPCQCSILAMGKPTETIVPIDNNMVLRKVVSLTLAADHRIVSGDYAASFLKEIVDLLERPERLTD